MFKLKLTEIVHFQLTELEKDKGLEKRLKAVRKALSYLQLNPRHPSFNTHKFEGLSNKDIEVFEAYAENNIPGAYRIFFHYGPGDLIITIIAIIKHP